MFQYFQGYRVCLHKLQQIQQRLSLLQQSSELFLGYYGCNRHFHHHGGRSLIRDKPTVVEMIFIVLPH